MNRVKHLSGKTVAVDSAPLIYFVEHHPDYYKSVQPFFAALDNGGLKALTSAVTVAEALVHPLRHGRADLVEVYDELFANYLPAVPVTTEIARLAAKLRAEHNFRTPDALELATAVIHQADFFLTNDTRLARFNLLAVLVISDLTD